MPKKVTVEEWVAELESGKWKPASGQLAALDPDNDYDVVPDERCCLGVLCEMVGIDCQWNDGYPDVDQGIYDYVPWLVDRYVNTTDGAEREKVIAKLEQGVLQQEDVLSDFAAVNDGMFEPGYKPKDFSPVVEKIREWYGLDKGEA